MTTSIEINNGEIQSTNIVSDITLVEGSQILYAVDNQGYIGDPYTNIFKLMIGTINHIESSLISNTSTKQRGVPDINF